MTDAAFQFHFKVGKLAVIQIWSWSTSTGYLVLLIFFLCCLSRYGCIYLCVCVPIFRVKSFHEPDVLFVADSSFQLHVCKS